MLNGSLLSGSNPLTVGTRARSFLGERSVNGAHRVQYMAHALSFTNWRTWFLCSELPVAWHGGRPVGWPVKPSEPGDEQSISSLETRVGVTFRKSEEKQMLQGPLIKTNASRASNQVQSRGEYI